MRQIIYHIKSQNFILIRKKCEMIKMTKKSNSIIKGEKDKKKIQQEVNKKL